MEQEINVRAYIEILLRYWVWIVGLAVIAAIVAFILGSRAPVTYTANAVVLETTQRYYIQFDSAFRTSRSDEPAMKTYPTLATSDSILQSVAEAYEPAPGSAIQKLTLGTLKSITSATTDDSPSMMLLRVRSRYPEDAATIASLWADVFVKEANEIYIGGERDLAFFEEQVALAEEALNTAEAEYISFQANDHTDILKTQLASLNEAQLDYLTTQNEIAYTLQDVQGLRNQLADPNNPDSGSAGDQLTALLLQIKAFNATTEEGIVLQVDGSSMISEKGSDEQIAFLDELATTLKTKSTEIKTRLAELEIEILSLQQQYREASLEQNRVVRTRDLAENTYLTLARKLEEARISAQESEGLLRVGSYAATPTKPNGTRRMFNTVAAGLLGLTVGVVGTFAIEFWRNTTPQEQASSEEE